MKRIEESNPVVFYVADDGRKFTNEAACQHYEYLCGKWGDKGYEMIDTEDKKIMCYLVNSYEEIREVKEYEHDRNWAYNSILPESQYTFPCWVYVPFNHEYEDCSAIQPLSHLKDCVSDVEQTLREIKDAIADMEGRLPY